MTQAPWNLTLHSVEHHLFKAKGRWLLFDVNALTVLPSTPLDGRILEAAAGPITRDALIDTVAATGTEREDVERRVTELIDHRFLLTPGETPDVAQLKAPTSYVTFMVNVSQRCNLTCPYCYVNKGLFDYEEKPIPRMEAATADQIVEKIHQGFPGFETYGYHFYGGEPLMNFEAIRRVVAAAEIKSSLTETRTDYHITTNGTLLNREIADFMDAHRFTVYFSIDGDKEHHDELRKYVNGKGSYGDVEQNLAYLRSKPGVHLIGSSVIRKGFSLGEAIEMLENHGAGQCKAERVRLPETDLLSLQGRDHETYIDDIQSLIDHYINSLTKGRKPMDFRLSSKILQVLTRVRRNFFCPAGDRMFGISANGELYPCALHVGRPQSKLGDVFNGIDREKQRAFRARFSADNQDDCRSCWTRHLCGSGCSAMVDRFGHEDCRSLRAESEAAIAIYQHFAESDPVKLYGLVSPKIAKWINGELDDPDELLPTEPAARENGCGCHGGHTHATDLYQLSR